MSLAKSVYPPPPPTTNELTVNQRSQLRKSTRKIGKILGITPRLVEQPSKPIALNLPLSPGAYEHSVRFGSNDDSPPSPASSSCSSSPPSSATSTQGFFRYPIPNSTTSSLSTLSDQEDAPLPPPKDLWPALKQPSLRISTQSDPASPSTTPRTLRRTSHYTKSRHSRSHSLDGFRKDSSLEENPCFTLAAPPATQTRDSLVFIPSFHVATDSTARRQKMERVKRTLGENVPFELVFPSSSLQIEGRHSSEHSREPTPIPPKMTDSSHGSGSSSHKIRRVPAPKWDATTEDEKSAKRAKVLSIILESPDF